MTFSHTYLMDGHLVTMATSVGERHCYCNKIITPTSNRPVKSYNHNITIIRIIFPNSFNIFSYSASMCSSIIYNQQRHVQREREKQTIEQIV